MHHKTTLDDTNKDLTNAVWLVERETALHFHTVTLLQKIIHDRKPDNIFKKIHWAQRETRTSDRQTLVDKRSFKTMTALRSFLPRSISEWNKLPLGIRERQSKQLFKNELRTYIVNNIPVK